MDTRHFHVLLDSPFRIQLLLTIGGAIGIAAIFLPFAWGTAPLGAALDKDLWRLAWPFFLPALVTPVSVHWLISGKLSWPECLVAFFVSTATVCITVSMYVTMPGWPPDIKAWLGFVFPIVMLVFGVFTLLRARRNLTTSPLSAVLSMQVAYLANFLLCLTSFFGEWQIGVFCSLVTAIAYVIQLGLVWRRDGANGKTFLAEN